MGPLLIGLHVPQIIDWTVLSPNQRIKLFALPFKTIPRHFCFVAKSDSLTVNTYKKYTQVSNPEPEYKKKVSKGVYLNKKKLN